MAHKIAFVGFGTVGVGLAEILLEKEAVLTEQLHESIRVVAVSDALKGSLYDPQGLDLQQVLQAVKETGKLDAYPDSPTLTRNMDSFQTIAETNAQTIVEVTFTNVKTGQPAIDHCRTAFEHGKNVVTTNKGPVALAYQELSALAQRQGVRFGFEGTVMSGTPSLRMPLTALTANDIYEVKGIFNGTTNYILTQMESGMTYEDALREAQRRGFAEADPTSDVEGYDAMYKILILCQVVLGLSVTPEDVRRTGISHITLADVAAARMSGKRYKLLARARKTSTGVEASVGPELLDLDDPLAGIGQAVNAITYECDLSGPITLVGAGAGKTETGFSLLIDIINIIRNQI